MNTPSTASHPDSIDGAHTEKEQVVTTNVLEAVYNGDPEKRSVSDSDPGSEHSVEIVRKAEDVAILVF